VDIASAIFGGVSGGKNQSNIPALALIGIYAKPDINTERNICLQSQNIHLTIIRPTLSLNFAAHPFMVIEESLSISKSRKYRRNNWVFAMDLKNTAR
jgi:hypothetical protein